jgi:hypothetical protein
MPKTDWFLKLTLLAIALFLGMIALRPYVSPDQSVKADSGQFDYVQIISAQFIYNGATGVLLLDKRNGNVWFTERNNDNMTLAFKDPVFVVRVPLEKLDANAR